MSLQAIYICGISLVWAMFFYFCHTTWQLWQMIATGQLTNL
jgi:hypothetical protein